MKCPFCRRLRTKMCEITCAGLFGLSVLTGNAEMPERLKVDPVAIELLRPINSTSTAALSTSLSTLSTSGLPLSAGIGALSTPRSTSFTNTTSGYINTTSGSA